MNSSVEMAGEKYVSEKIFIEIAKSIGGKIFELLCSPHDSQADMHYYSSQIDQISIGICIVFLKFRYFSFLVLAFESTLGSRLEKQALINTQGTR